VRTFTTLFILIVCVLVGSGIYFFFHQTGTQSPPESTIDTTISSIQGIPIASTTEAGATITWKTDKPATSQVNYGKTETYGSTTPLDTNLSTSHSVTLTGLDSNTTYNFKVISTDAAGNEITSAASQTFTTLTPIPIGSKVGNRAPDFTLEDLNGQKVSLSALRGKIVMVNFWATWCIPCKNELPFFQAISDNWSEKDLTILAISKESKPTVLNWIKSQEKEYTFTFLLDSKGEVNTLYGFTDQTSIPRTFFIDAEGIIKKIKVDSFSSKNEIEDILNSLK
jgi:peroxiredoxin